jgi:hypothetical protein
MTTELLATLRNDNDGLEALIMEGNDKFNYRVVLRDSDADATIVVQFRHNYFECDNIAREFLLNEITHINGDTL